jgi:hypothetical protein
MWWARLLNNIAGVLGTFGVVAGDYEPLQTVTVGSGGSTSIDFTSIPSTYKHLQIRYMGRWTGTSIGYATFAFTFNGDTTASYSGHELYGTGSGTPGAGGGGSRNAGYSTWIPDSTTTSTFGVGVLDILDYANTNKYKTTRCIGGFSNNTAGNQLVGMQSASWQKTNAITSINLSGFTFAQYSHFALYGIKG